MAVIHSVITDDTIAHVVAEIGTAWVGERAYPQVLVGVDYWTLSDKPTVAPAVPVNEKRIRLAREARYLGLDVEVPQPAYAARVCESIGEAKRYVTETARVLFEHMRPVDRELVLDDEPASLCEHVAQGFVAVGPAPMIRLRAYGLAQGRVMEVSVNLPSLAGWMSIERALEDDGTVPEAARRAVQEVQDVIRPLIAARDALQEQIQAAEERKKEEKKEARREYLRKLFFSTQEA